MDYNNYISYIELKTNDIELVKKFYGNVFDWEFTDYGQDYTSFNKSGIPGGFVKTDEKIANQILLVLYHKDLEKVQTKIKENGGTISKEIFEFPGGKRFHFIDPTGNELAVWSE